MKIKIYALFFLLLIMACRNSDPKKTQQAEIKQLKTPLDSLSQLIKTGVEIDDFTLSKDTLNFVSSDRALYFPMGRYRQIDSLLKHYPLMKLEIQNTNTPSGVVKLYRLKYKDNFVKFYENDVHRMDIVYGKIVDPAVSFENGLKIGETKADFLKRYFKKEVYLKQVNNIKISSVVAGIIHYYHFENEKLSSIVIDSDYQLEKD